MQASHSMPMLFRVDTSCVDPTEHLCQRWVDLKVVKHLTGTKTCAKQTILYSWREEKRQTLKVFLVSPAAVQL